MIVLIFNSILMGVGLAMDAFSVSIANGLNEPHMKGSRATLIAGVFAVFQTLMPLIGYVFVKGLVSIFTIVSNYIPFVATALLFFIGGKMILDSIGGGENTEAKPVSFKNLMIQGVATSIDALSVGFTIEGYVVYEAVISAVLIGIVTFIICFIGLKIGNKVGEKFQSKAGVLGGCVLIAIGIEELVIGVSNFI